MNWPAASMGVIETLGEPARAKPLLLQFQISPWREPSPRRAVSTCMDATSDDTKTNVLRRIGAQPVALAAGALIVVVLAAGSVGLWRAYTGTSPEQERFTSLRQMQARATQASEQLFEKTKNLEASQQETI